MRLECLRGNFGAKKAEEDKFGGHPLAPVEQDLGQFRFDPLGHAEALPPELQLGVSPADLPGGHGRGLDGLGGEGGVYLLETECGLFDPEALRYV